jgi:hypothetical protein
MKRRTGTLAAAAMLAMLTALRGPAFAQATDPEGYGDGYGSGDYGRIRSADSGATILRANTESGESDRASVNAPLFPGDLLRTADGQRVEVQLAGGSMVRIDTGADVLFQSMPNPSAKFQDNTVIGLKAGVIRVTSRLAEKEEFRIDTPDASVYLLGEGEFRIAAGDRNGTRVESLRGVAEVVGNEASVLVRGGMGTAVVAGSAPGTPRAHSALASDGFDRWCAARDDAYRAHDHDVNLEQPRDVPDEVRPYYGELSAQGSFDVDPDYGVVWYPTGVSSDWRPYYDGYWSYGPGGYFWVSNEPWGWAPYHYGCWQWTSRHRWCWVPGHVFAGAWVSWSWGSLSVGWAPLDFWGGAAWIGGPLYAGYYDSHCWTFVNYDHFGSRNVHRYAVPIDSVRDDLRHATVVTRGPSIDPRRIARSPDWRSRALRQVADDRAAHMAPTLTDRRPERKLSDVQEQLMRRPYRPPQTDRGPRGAGAASIAPSMNAPHERRILEDPRAGAGREVRPQTRDDVRELYQRMSRPRETREQAPPDASRHQDPRVQDRRPSPDVSRHDDGRRAEPPRPQPRVENPREQRRVETPRPQAPREERRAEAPRPQPPRQQPRAEPPRSQPQPHQDRAPRPQGHGQERPQHGGRR